MSLVLAKGDPRRYLASKALLEKGSPRRLACSIGDNFHLSKRLQISLARDARFLGDVKPPWIEGMVLGIVRVS
jgi:hypothetical protein